MSIKWLSYKLYKFYKVYLPINIHNKDKFLFLIFNINSSFKDPNVFSGLLFSTLDYTDLYMDVPIVLLGTVLNWTDNNKKINTVNIKSVYCIYHKKTIVVSCVNS